jgi:hypothetical protein
MIILNQNRASNYYRTFEIHTISSEMLEKLSNTSLVIEEWQEILSVYVSHNNEPTDAEKFPLLGRYQITDGIIRFIPRYPLLDGVQYLAVSNHTQLKKIRIIFQLPQINTPTTVTQIYPSTDQIPENMLRFYIYFSAPMREEQALQHIHLIDDKRQCIRDVFLDPPQELWDITRTRLTLLFDPGRVKRGLTPHQQLGRALSPGKKYRLVVSNTWQDANLQPLSASFEKSFHVTSADTLIPNVADWIITPPALGTLAPLRVKLNKSFDHVLLDLCIQVKNNYGELIQGKTSHLTNETIWQFFPEKAWAHQIYYLIIDKKLEDLAGNNFYSLFDKPSQTSLLDVDNALISVPFTIAN